MDITTRLALQSQATRLTGRVPGGGDRTERGYDPLRLAVSTTNCTRCPVRNQTQTTIRRPGGADFHIELFPLHSPLLRESWLVSFPPLSNMFKFGGSSCLSSALVCYVLFRPMLWFDVLGACVDGYSHQRTRKSTRCIEAAYQSANRNVAIRQLLKRCLRCNSQRPL